MSTPPRIGVGVLIFRDKQVLLGKRLGGRGAGEWAPPGGHLEHNEMLLDCARREVLEETGLKLIKPETIAFTEDFFKVTDDHYITFFVMASIKGEPQNQEPDKCEGWQWFVWDKFPKPLFLSFNNFLSLKFNPLKP